MPKNMEQQSTKKRRGRPLKEPDEDRSATGQRRARVRQAQRDFRRRKEDTVAELRARIKMLEDTVEEMSTTIVGLSDSVLGSEHIRSHPQLITSIGESVKRALTLAESTTRDPDEETEAVEDDQDSSPDQPRDVVQSESASIGPTASGQGLPPSAARFLTMNAMGMQDCYMDPQFEAAATTEAVVQERNPVPQNVREMLTQNTFFTKEFWGGDYTSSANIHMIERPARPVPFWERLLRLNLTSVIHRLTNDGIRGDRDFCTTWEARNFKYSLQHKSKANILARTRWVIDNIAVSDSRVYVMERGMAGPNRIQVDWRPRIEAYFDSDDLRAFGAATMHSMVLAGYPVGNLVNAEEVESYMKEKGMVQVGENEIQLELTIPTPGPHAVKADAKPDLDGKVCAPTTGTEIRSRTSLSNPRSRSFPTRQSRPQKRMVKVSLDRLIERFTDLSICTGSGIGYPLGDINRAVVASVISIGN